MNISDRRKYIEHDIFTNVVEDISRSLGTLRTEYVVGSFFQLERQGISMSGISRNFSPGSELDAALIGFQLISIMDVTRDHIGDERDQLGFNKLLRSRLKAPEGSRTWNYREKYADCQGDIDSLSILLAADVHRLVGFPEPRKEFLNQFQGEAHILTMLSQVATHIACGDDEMAGMIGGQITARHKQSITVPGMYFNSPINSQDTGIPHNTSRNGIPRKTTHPVNSV
jgi:hypothetical protein